jgi:prepilin-type N-terminal cleavage/methylation domain-containing protein
VILPVGQRRATRSSLLQGFTIMEVMIVIAIIGVLAALGLPALTGYLRTSKTGEATANLNNIFKTAAAFYVQEQSLQGLTGNINTNCIVQSAARSPTTPTHQKQRFMATPGLRELGFSVGDEVYYSYGLTSVATGSIDCGYIGGNDAIYTFFANGDLDGDGTESTFTLVCGTDTENTLYHSRGIYVNFPIE